MQWVLRGCVGGQDQGKSYAEDSSRYFHWVQLDY